MAQNVRTSVIVPLGVLALSLLLLLCFSMLPVVHSQTQPGLPSAPPITVSVIEVSPKTLPLYTEYTGTTDALETVEIRARVDGFIEQKLFHGGRVIKAGERLYLLDQRTFSAEVQKAKAAVAKAEAELKYAKEGVEVFRAESRLAQSRAALIKTEQDVARYTPLVKEQAASQQDLDAAIAQRDVAREEVAARKTRCARLAELMHLLAELARTGTSRATPTGTSNDVDAWRRRISQKVEDIQDLIEASKFESGDFNLREIQKLTGDAQMVFILLLSLARQGRDVTQPHGVRTAGVELDSVIATALQALETRAAGGSEPAVPELEDALNAFERSMTGTDALDKEATDHLTGQLALYRTLVAAIKLLVPKSRNN